MKGIKKHSRQERWNIAEGLVPLLREKFGDNMIALAVQASCARSEDTDYSDLELIAFLGAMPGEKSVEGFSRIRDGLLIEVVWMTRDEYLRRTKEVTADWYIAGSDMLKPLVNTPFIEELNGYRAANLKEKCLVRAARDWHEMQESTAKVLTGISQGNRQGMPMLLFYLLRDSLKMVSLLNQRPYTTLARFTSEARTLPVKPARYDEFLDTMAEGGYTDLQRLEGLVIDVFEGFETIFENLGVRLYDDDPRLFIDGPGSG